MTTLAELFAADKRASGTDAAPRAVRASSMDGLFAGSKRPTPASVPADEAAALRAVVGGRAPAVQPAAGAVPKPTRIRRAGGVRDWVSIVLAILAVLTVVAAGGLAAARMASASPAEDALDNLKASEAQLVDAQEALNRGIAAAEKTRADGVAAADALAGTLAALTDISDEPARAAAEAARQTYLTNVAAIVLPAESPAYRRPAIDDTSLTSVGTAIDDVGAQLVELEPRSEQMSAARVALQKADDELAAALAAFAGSIPAFAAGIVDDNPDADDDLAVAVTDAAAALSSSDLRGAGAAAAVTVYADAVIALREDQELADEAARRAAEDEASRGGSGGTRNPGTGNSGGTGTTDPVQPTDPVEPTGPAQPTDPVEPTDPAQP